MRFLRLATGTVAAVTRCGGAGPRPGRRGPDGGPRRLLPRGRHQGQGPLQQRLDHLRGLRAGDRRQLPLRRQEIIPKIKALTDKPIRFAFDTHHHGDHAYGNQVWVENGAMPVAHTGVHRGDEEVRDRLLRRQARPLGRGGQRAPGRARPASSSRRRCSSRTADLRRRQAPRGAAPLRASPTPTATASPGCRRRRSSSPATPARTTESARAAPERFEGGASLRTGGMQEAGTAGVGAGRRAGYGIGEETQSGARSPRARSPGTNALSCTASARPCRSRSPARRTQ